MDKVDGEVFSSFADRDCEHFEVVIDPRFCRSPVVGGMPSDHAFDGGNSRPGGFRAVATRCSIKDSKSSEMEILKGVGFDIAIARISWFKIQELSDGTS